MSQDHRAKWEEKILMQDFVYFASVFLTIATHRIPPPAGQAKTAWSPPGKSFYLPSSIFVALVS